MIWDPFSNSTKGDTIFEIFQDTIIEIKCAGDSSIRIKNVKVNCNKGIVTLDLKFDKDDTLIVSVESINIKRAKNDDFQIKENGKNLKIQNIGKKILKTQSIKTDFINIFQDAKKLISKNANQEDKKLILAKYRYINTNSLLQDFAGLQSKTNPEIIDQIFNRDVTVFADGLSKFLVSRVKKELAISFFNDFKAVITDDKYKDMRMIFPNTYQELNFIDEKIYDYETYFPSIRRNLEYDMSHFPHNLRKIVKDSSTVLGNTLVNHAKEKYSIDVGLQLMENIIDSMHIGKAIEKLDLKNKDKDVMGIKKFLQTMQLFSFAFRSDDDERYYLSKDEFKELIEDTTLLKVFLGLTAAVAKYREDTTKLNYDPSIFDTIISLGKELTKVQKTIGNISYELTILEQSIYKINMDKDNKKFKIFDYFNAAGNFIQEIDNIVNTQNDDVVQSIQILNSSLGIISGIANKEYANTMIHFNRLIHSDKLIKSKITCKQKNKLGTYSELVKKIQKYGIFAASLAETKDADEVAKLIEAFAAPVGSWRDKRNSKWNIAIDSYVGAGVLREGHLTKSESPTYFAVSTPIGISISHTLGCLGSITILGSFIDIGPLTAFRFKNADDQIAKVYLKEIYSPGIHCTWGIGKKCIFNVTGGWQKFSSLSSVMKDQNIIQSQNRTGWSIGASVNIPLLTIYNKK
jgi:hypothetical protein